MWAALAGLFASRPLRVAFSLCCVGFACYLWGYTRGSAREALQGEIRAGSALLEFQAAARRAEEAARAEQSRIAEGYEIRLQEVRHAQEELQSRLADYELVDAVHVPSVPVPVPERVQCPAVPAASAGRVSGGAKARGGLACYTEGQLRRKIAESVAIGQECDREMIRFQKLIEACNGR